MDWMLVPVLENVPCLRSKKLWFVLVTIKKNIKLAVGLPNVLKAVKQNLKGVKCLNPFIWILPGYSQSLCMTPDETSKYVEWVEVVFRFYDHQWENVFSKLNKAEVNLSHEANELPLTEWDKSHFLKRSILPCQLDTDYHILLNIFGLSHWSVFICEVNVCMIVRSSWIYIFFSQ